MKRLREWLYVMRNTGERATPDTICSNLFADHITRYMFCEALANDKYVLDDGCGYGYGSVYLAENGARMVIGTDISRDAIKYAKKHFRRNNLEYKVMDGTNLSISEHFFDMVVSIEVIEHIYNYKKYLSEIFRVLKPGGLLVISTPNKKISSPNSAHPISSFHVKEFYPDEFQVLLESQYEEVKIFGKRVINQEFLTAENRTLTSKSVRFSMLLPRTIRRLIPLRVKQLLLPTTLIALTTDDFEISEKEIDSASNIIAICRKAS